MSGASYDPTLKDLVEVEPASWPVLFGYAKAPTRIIDADIATVSGAADKVLHVAAARPYLLHLEFVAGHDAAALPPALLMRSSLLAYRHDLPVRSGVVLLHPQADSPQLTGSYQRGLVGEEPYVTFRYAVVRVWQLDPQVLLRGGLSLLPLAPISAVTEAELPSIIKQMERRLHAQRGRKRVSLVWGAAYILLGLRYSPDLAAQLFRGVLSMKESSTYRAILEEGRQEGFAEGSAVEARKLLRLFGEARLGAPDAETAAVIDAIEDVARLEELCVRLSAVGSWRELLERSSSRSRKGRRHSSP
jgi:hypothetical protein